MSKSTDKDAVPNRGGQFIAKMFEGHGGQTRCAEAVGRKVSTVSRWIRCIRKPGIAERFILLDRLGIPIAWWDEDPVPEAALLAAVAARSAAPEPRASLTGS